MANKVKRLLGVMAAAALGGLAPAGVQAAVVINILQIGSDVVASGSGTFNTTGSTTSISNPNVSGVILSNTALIKVGSGGQTFYSSLSGPSSFGNGGSTPATTSSGDVFGMNGGNQLFYLPINYVSGAALSGTATFANKTFASLGLNPGTYVFKAASDTFTVNVGPPTPTNPTAPVPEPATWGMMILGMSAISFAIRSARRRQRELDAESERNARVTLV